VDPSVLFVQNRTHRAGAQTCLERLLRHEVIRRWNPTLVCSPGGWLATECSRRGMSVIETRFPRSRSLPARLFGNAAFARHVRRALDAQQIRPVIVHANDHTEGLLGLEVARHVAARTAIFLRSPTMTRNDYFKYRCARYDLVAAVGDDFRARVQAWDPRREIALIHDGIFVEEIGPPKSKPSEPPRRVLVIGSPLAWKGWADLTEALFLLERTGALPLMRFDFTGTAPDRAGNDLRLERLAKAQCDFLGRVEAFRDLVLGYDLVINPSRAETFGMAAIEVLAAGVPLLSSRTGVIEQVLERSDMLFRPSDPRALAEALRRLFGRWSELDFGVARAQERIRQLFRIDRTVACLDAAYRRLSDRNHW
jgi:glycosyltransferase involved in cell wall biosynthesis